VTDAQTFDALVKLLRESAKSLREMERAHTEAANALQDQADLYFLFQCGDCGAQITRYTPPHTDCPKAKASV